MLGFRRAIASALMRLPWTCPGILTAWGELGGWGLLWAGVRPGANGPCRGAGGCLCGRFKARTTARAIPLTMDARDWPVSDEPEAASAHPAATLDPDFADDLWDTFVDWLASGEPTDKAEFERVAPYHWRYTMRLWDSPEGDRWASGYFEWCPPEPPRFGPVVMGGYRWAGIEEVSL